MKIRWPSLWFGPINLWTAPHQPALEDTMTAVENDAVQDQLCARIDELEREKEVLVAQLDQAEEEAAKARQSRVILKDSFTTEVQRAVMRARIEWGKEDVATLARRDLTKQAEELDRIATNAPSRAMTADMYNLLRNRIRDLEKMAKEAPDGK